MSLSLQMNPSAAEYIPLFTLKSMPFFLQRLERFLFTNYKITDMDPNKLQIRMEFPPIAPQTKQHTVFFGQYDTIPLLYEATRWNDPRTGAFIKVA